MVLNVDFPSLFADYAGIPMPDFLNGQSFRENVKGDTPHNWRKSMYYRYWLHQSNRPAHFGIRNERYKLAFFYGQPLGKPGTHTTTTLPAWEFFDLQKDPKEMHNAYEEEAYAAVIKTMKKELMQLRMDCGDMDAPYPIMQKIMQEYWE